MPKYRKKPVVVDAFYYAICEKELEKWFKSIEPEHLLEFDYSFGFLIIQIYSSNRKYSQLIKTEAPCYIVRDEFGKYYVLKKDLFAEAYEAVEE